MNQIIIIGNLGKDPELKHTQDGKAVCTFSIADTEKYGQREHTEWHRVVVWGNQAESCAQYLAKGKKAFIIGRLETRKYNDKDGNEREIKEVIANKVQFLSPAEGQGGSRESGQRAGGQGGYGGQGGQRGGGNQQRGGSQGGQRGGGNQGGRGGNQGGWDDQDGDYNYGGNQGVQGGQGGYDYGSDDDIPF